MTTSNDHSLPVSAESTAPRKRPRHLIDPDAPRRPRDLAAERQRLTTVQQWVLSALAVTTILHMSAGLILAAMFLPEERGAGAQVGLNVIAAAFGVMAVAVARAIHRRSPLSAWLLLGLIPGIVGSWLTFR
ncbi:hypothetical protein [Marmoricola sp. URHA0025 HA25]